MGAEANDKFQGEHSARLWHALSPCVLSGTPKALTNIEGIPTLPSTENEWNS